MIQNERKERERLTTSGGAKKGTEKRIDNKQEESDDDDDEKQILLKQKGKQEEIPHAIEVKSRNKCSNLCVSCLHCVQYCCCCTCKWCSDSSRELVWKSFKVCCTRWFGAPLFFAMFIFLMIILLYALVLKDQVPITRNIFGWVPFVNDDIRNATGNHTTL